MSYEHTEEQRFEPYLCTGETIEGFEYQVYFGVSGYWPNQPPFYAEERFLDLNEFDHSDYRDAEDILSLPNVEAQAQSTLRAIPPTQEVLGELHQQSQSALRSWGASVLADALARQADNTSLRLVSAITQSETMDRLGRVPRFGEDRHFEERLAEAGHFLLPADGSQPSVLVVRSGEGSDLQAVNLDALDNTFPGLVGQRIADWHLANAQAILSSSALRNLSRHELSLEEIAPNFLVELAEMEPEQRRLEVAQCLAILDRVAALGNSRADIHHTFSDALFKLKGTGGALYRGISQEDVYLRDVLNHVTSCSGRDIDQSLVSKQAETIRSVLLERASQPTPTEIHEADRPMLERPATYLFNLDRDREMQHSWSSRRELVLAEAALMRNQSENTNLAGTLEAIRLEDPDRFATLQSLRELLGTRPELLSREEIPQLDALIDEIAQGCARTGYLHGPSPNNLQELRQMISNKLTDAFYWKKNRTPDGVMPMFEGVSIDELYHRRDSVVYANNPHLKHTLSFLTLIRARELAASTPRSNNISQLMEELLVATEQDAQRHDGVIDSLQERSLVADNLFARHGLSEADFRPLAAMASETVGRLATPYPLYTLLANMIVMTRHGQANIFSPAQRGLVETLFQSNIYEETAEELSRAWQALDEYRESRASTS